MKEEDTRASGKLHLFCKLGISTVTHTDWETGQGEAREASQLHAQGYSPCLGTEGSVPAPSITFLGSSNTAS